MTSTKYVNGDRLRPIPRNRALIVHDEANAEIAERERQKKEAEKREEELIDELARRNALDYARRRRDEAEILGVNVSDLDRAVRERRRVIQEEMENPPPVGHWVVTPWPDPVEGTELLQSLVACIKTHIKLGHNEVIACALWIMMTWLHSDIARYSPLLLITSAVGGEGKTELLEQSPIRLTISGICQVCGAFSFGDLIETRDDGLAEASDGECAVLERI